MTATALLNLQLLTIAQRGDRPRCSDPVDHERWTSDHEANRAIAALWCNDCVVLTLCGDAAVERGEKWGAWGGKDLTRR
jgi:hypothetical protein